MFLSRKVFNKMERELQRYNYNASYEAGSAEYGMLKASERPVCYLQSRYMLQLIETGRPVQSLSVSPSASGVTQGFGMPPLNIYASTKSLSGKRAATTTGIQIHEP